MKTKLKSNRRALVGVCLLTLFMHAGLKAAEPFAGDLVRQPQAWWTHQGETRVAVTVSAYRYDGHPWLDDLTPAQQADPLYTDSPEAALIGHVNAQVTIEADMAVGLHVRYDWGSRCLFLVRFVDGEETVLWPFPVRLGDSGWAVDASLDFEAPLFQAALAHPFSIDDTRTDFPAASTSLLSRVRLYDEHPNDPLEVHVRLATDQMVRPASAVLPSALYLDRIFSLAATGDPDSYLQGYTEQFSPGLFDLFRAAPAQLTAAMRFSQRIPDLTWVTDLDLGNTVISILADDANLLEANRYAMPFIRTAAGEVWSLSPRIVESAPATEVREAVNDLLLGQTFLDGVARFALARQMPALTFTEAEFRLNRRAAWEPVAYSLSWPLDAPFTATWQIIDSDLMELATGTTAIGAGESRGGIEVPMDALRGASHITEATIRFQNPSAAVHPGAYPTARTRFFTADPVIRFEQSVLANARTQLVAQVPLTLSCVYTNDITAELAVQAFSTATAAEDYLILSPTVIFTAGQTRAYLDIDVLPGDAMQDKDLFLQLRVDDWSGGASADPEDVFTLVLRRPEFRPVVQFAEAVGINTSTNDGFDVVVQLAVPLPDPVIVPFAIAAATDAVAGEDFILEDVALLIPVGATQAAIRVTLPPQEGLRDAMRRLVIELSEPSANAALGERHRFVLVIP